MSSSPSANEPGHLGLEFCLSSMESDLPGMKQGLVVIKCNL